MEQFDRKLYELARTEPPEAPPELMARVRAELNALPERRTPHQSAGWRPLRLALAAVLALALLTGTALAASPALRELLWGGFEPYVQELESTPENTQIYDGVELRIVSALSDGAVNILHVEVRDTTGDRVRAAWERYQATGENEFRDRVELTAMVERVDPASDLAQDGGFSRGWAETGLGARPIGFDPETGVMTLRLTRITAAPPEMDRQAELTADSGLLGTEPLTQELSADDSWTYTVTEDGRIVQQESGQGSAWTKVLPGWTLTADLAPLTPRTVDIPATPVPAQEGQVLDKDLDPVVLPDNTLALTQVRVSQLGITLSWTPAGKYDSRQAPDELTVTLTDGRTLTLSGWLEDHFSADFHQNDTTWKCDSWLFPDPLDPSAVASLTLGGVEIPLK